MTLLDTYLRVTRSGPCPICGKPDWCLVERANPHDPATVICARVESPTRCRDAGWLDRVPPIKRRLRGIEDV